MFFIKLTLLKIKRMLRFLPGVLAGALALCFITGIFAYSANKLLYSKTTVEKQTIGVVRPQNDKYIDLTLGMVKNVKSVDALCEFVYIDNEQSVLNGLKNGELDAAVILPYRFIQDIVHGENTPARVILPENSRIYGQLFKGLADNGIGMLADVQAAVQAGFYAVSGSDYEQLVSKTDEFNMMYFDIYLPREALFSEQIVSASGSLITWEYYGIMAAVILMLLCGSCLAFITGGEEKAFRLEVRRRGINRAMLYVANHIMIFVFYLLLVLLLLGGVYAAGIDIRIDVVAIVLALLLISALVSAVYTLFAGGGGALVLFALTLVSAFAGGAVLPQAFLPQSIAAFSVYSPVYVLFDCLTNLFTEQFAFSSSAVYCVMLASVWILTLLVERIREVAEV